MESNGECWAEDAFWTRGRQRAAVSPLNCPLYSPPAEKTHRGSNQAAEHKVHWLLRELNKRARLLRALVQSWVRKLESEDRCPNLLPKDRPLALGRGHVTVSIGAAWLVPWNQQMVTHLLFYAPYIWKSSSSKAEENDGHRTALCHARRAAPMAAAWETLHKTFVVVSACQPADSTCSHGDINWREIRLSFFLGTLSMGLCRHKRC